MPYNPFTQAVIDVVRSIPRGKILTYGEVARLSGSPRAARQVVRVLSTLSTKENLPWHRVVGKGGKILLSGEGQSHQRQLLLEEGIECDATGIQIKDFTD